MNDQPERQDDLAVHGMLREMKRVDVEETDEAFVKRVMESVSQPAPRRKPVRRMRWLAAAALLATVIALPFLLKKRRPTPITVERPVQVATIGSETATVQRKNAVQTLSKGDVLTSADVVQNSALLLLADGSTAKLDTGSRLGFAKPDGGKRMHLKLLTGRIFLRVAKTDGRFVVEADATVEVKGTVFGVTRQPGGTDVSVFEGKVSVSNAGTSLDIERGQSASAASGQAPKLSDTDPNVALLWARDWTRFENRPIIDVFLWIEDNSRYKLRFDPDRLKDKTVTIAISDEPVEQVLEQLAVACGLDLQIDGNKITVEPW